MILAGIQGETGEGIQTRIKAKTGVMEGTPVFFVHRTCENKILLTEERRIPIKTAHVIVLAAGFTVFPLLGVIFYQTAGLVGGFAVGLAIAAILSLTTKPEESRGKRGQPREE